MVTDTLTAPVLELDPDRLFPIDASARRIARELYQSVADKPIISPHGHVAAELLLDNKPFADATELFIRYDHYVTRVLHSAGLPLEDIGIPSRDGSRDVASPRDAWRRFCAHWLNYAGTASAYWLRDVFVTQFGIKEHPHAGNADRLFDHIGAQLATEQFLPRTLFDRFDIELLATTDDPLSDLDAHRALADDPTFHGRVVPTFRPDAYLDPSKQAWTQLVSDLAEWHGTPRSSYQGYIQALAARRCYFIDHGAVSADHGVAQPLAVELDSDTAASLFATLLRGDGTDDDKRVFTGHMLFQMARMSVEDGLVMTIHPGVYRNHSTDTFDAFGPDMGNDIPVRTEYVRALQPLLRRFGNNPDLHLVLFTVDETVYSREIAPLAGFYPSVYIGAPWWFLDAPDAVGRFRAASTETAGFYRSSGFIDDTRAYLSIPARHDMSRRLDATYLARLVGEGRLDAGSASQIIDDLVVSQPRKVFKL